MKQGDFVRKSEGQHKGRIGIVIAVKENLIGNTIVSVFSEGEIKNWYIKYVEVVSESR